jgi:hypothetical protein
MSFHLMKICLGLVDIVEDSLIQVFQYQDHKTVGIAETLESARWLAKHSGFRIRHEAETIRPLNQNDVESILQEACDHGMELHRALESLLPSMSEEAKRKYVS